MEKHEPQTPCPSCGYPPHAGHARDCPVSGQSKEKYPKTREELISFSDLDVDTLKSVNEKCTREYDDKYRGAKFGVNMELSSTEQEEVGKLLWVTKTELNKLEQGEAWQQFINLLEQRRAKFGTMGEASYIIEDASVAVPKSGVKQVGGRDLPSIHVPAHIYRLYHWQLKFDTTAEELRLYQTPSEDKKQGGLAYARSAKEFGRDIKDLYRFNKEFKASKQT